MLFFPYCVGLFTNGAKAMFGKTFDSFAIVTCSHYIPHLQKKPLKASKLLILIISNLISNFNPWVLIFLIILWPNGRSAKRTCTPYKLSQGGEVEGKTTVLGARPFLRNRDHCYTQTDIGHCFVSVVKGVVIKCPADWERVYSMHTLCVL